MKTDANARAQSIDGPFYRRFIAWLVGFEDGSDEALPLLQKVVKQRNDIRIAYVDLGAILTQQKRYDEAHAQEASQPALSASPSSSGSSTSLDEPRAQLSGAESLLV